MIFIATWKRHQARFWWGEVNKTLLKLASLSFILMLLTPLPIVQYTAIYLCNINNIYVCASLSMRPPYKRVNCYRWLMIDWWFYSSWVIYYINFRLPGCKRYPVCVFLFDSILNTFIKLLRSGRMVQSVKASQMLFWFVCDLLSFNKRCIMHYTFYHIKTFPKIDLVI